MLTVLIFNEFQILLILFYIYLFNDCYVKVWGENIQASEAQQPTKMFTFDKPNWQETSWSMGTDGNNDKSEHAITQPITMSRRPDQFPGPMQPKSVTSPRSADGSVLGFLMVEYVLASSPGGHDIETRMKEMKLNNNMVIQNSFLLLNSFYYEQYLVHSCS